MRSKGFLEGLEDFCGGTTVRRMDRDEGEEKVKGIEEELAGEGEGMSKKKWRSMKVNVRIGHHHMANERHE
ncbi:unnamed protein product [Dovyalis caffra]|uniref:LEAFY-like protein n=1 Tax=Dovyalis caffra TaxID=77055 RepID=A0AAV1SXV2_9ROSI|nr:unnamed protein product [Dovyalis caffra]